MVEGELYGQWPGIGIAHSAMQKAPGARFLHLLGNSRALMRPDTPVAALRAVLLNGDTKLRHPLSGTLYTSAHV
jgi:hypothetical protein